MGMNAGSSKKPLPRWNISTIYDSLEDPAFIRDKNRLKSEIRLIEKLVDDFSISKKNQDPAVFLKDFIARYNRAADLYESLSAYAYMMYTTDTKDAVAGREISTIETIGIPLRKAEPKFRNLLGTLRISPADYREYSFFLREQIKLRKRQMAPELEELAADLSRSGGDAWERLQQAVSAGLSLPWDGGKRKTLVELRALAFDKDRKVRERAYKLELEGWKSVETPLSFAINGVKGFSISLNYRRNYKNTLERSVLQGRITQKTLDTLIGVMTEALPMFRAYLKTKARTLGLKKLAFYDLFAPLGKGLKPWPYKEAAIFIVEMFARFSPELGGFAKRALEAGWIDAEPRPGKIGGAYCIDIPKTRECRIFCNYDNSISSVTTLAHELGHAYHYEVLKNESAIHRSYPMTLAETASIFAETVVFEGALQTAPPEGRLTLIENYLQDATQVIVDILSRFIFEKDLFDRREEGDLSPEELGEMMVKAQKETYGNALDEKSLHPYMWAVKGHYYRQDLGFYNFPYAFGLLFGLGLYARYKKEGPGFAESYKKILLSTGKGTAVEVARKAGCDIEDPDFWRAGIDTIAGYVKQFEGLVRNEK
jgi:pepF/M3 family oligoendopeptidase